MEKKPLWLTANEYSMMSMTVLRLPERSAALQTTSHDTANGPRESSVLSLTHGPQPLPKVQQGRELSDFIYTHDVTARFTLQSSN
ncbi:hypothetical protein BaRGS_00019964, partial [Batillaria attramentaria]